MDGLIEPVRYLVVSRFQCINYRMRKEQNPEASTPPKSYPERDDVKKTVYKQVIPVLAFRPGDKIAL